MASRWDVTVMTAPGRKTPTLQKCVDSVVAAGWDDLLVSCDNHIPCPVEASGGILRLRSTGPKILGPWGHFMDLVGRRLAFSEWDQMLVVQDDAILAKGLRQWIGDVPGHVWQIESVGVTSLWLPGFHARQHGGGQSLRIGQDAVAWWQLEKTQLPRQAYGALAIVLTRDRAEKLCCWRGSQGSSKTDYWLGKFCEDTDKHWVYPTRSMVQHIGEGNSTLDTGERSPLYRLADNPITDCYFVPT